MSNVTLKIYIISLFIFTSVWDKAVGLFSGVLNISLNLDFGGVEVCI